MTTPVTPEKPLWFENYSEADQKVFLGALLNLAYTQEAKDRVKEEWSKAMN